MFNQGWKVNLINFRNQFLHMQKLGGHCKKSGPIWCFVHTVQKYEEEAGMMITFFTEASLVVVQEVIWQAHLQCK
jgi:hypothetical protein